MYRVHYAWFSALRFRSSVSVTVFVKPVHTAVAVMPFGAEWACQIVNRLGPDWPSGLAGEYPALPSGQSSRLLAMATEKIELDPTGSSKKTLCFVRLFIRLNFIKY